MLNYFNPLAWLRWFGEFVYSWMLSVPWRDTPKAIPAIILIVVLSTLGIVAITEGGWRNRLLSQQLKVAWEKDDYATAELVLLRQQNGNPNDPEVVYRLAIANDKQLKHTEAENLMRQLVASKKHEGAARWLLTKNYVGQQWGELSENERDEFGMLLALLTEKQPKDIGVRQLYADYLIAANKLPQVVPILDELSEHQPMRGLQAAAIERRLGNFSSANRFAEKTLDAVNKLSEEDPTNAVLALAVAQNQLFLERFAEAVRTLQRSLDRVTSKEDLNRLNQAMGDALVAWVAHIKESSTDTVSERIRIMKMLEYALKAAPSNRRVLTLVADQVLATMDETDEEIAARRRTLIAGAAPGIQHFIEGTSALMKNNVDSALVHLTTAAELLPRSGAILNNLAVALATRPDGDLEQALKVSNQAIELTEKPTAHFYETRGQILFRMENYQEAIPDLTRALKVLSLAPKAHQSLSVCYDKLGEKDFSEEHAKAAKRTAKELARLK